MPVEDHEIHPATQHGSEFRYGCNNDKSKPKAYAVLTRKYYGNHYVMETTFVQQKTSRACRYMDYEGDQGCTDCRQPKDMEYINKMRVLK